ncbi:unnamed protein product [Closterium sp. NIES-53]
MQNSQKQYADRQRRDHSVAVGDQVLLDTRNLNLSHLPSKLRPRFCGPFLVEAQVTPVTFRLRLPDTWKLHNAFHVQLLKPYKDPNQQFQGWQLPPPPPVLIQDEPEYEVERVLTHRRHGGKTLEFLLRWKGYDPTEDSWVAEADMGNARRALKDYLVKQGPSAPRPQAPRPLGLSAPATAANATAATATSTAATATSTAATAAPATAQALYDAVVTHYSLPATAALGRLLLPYLFPELSAFATVEDLVSHLRTSDAHYRATVPAEFLDRNQPPIAVVVGAARGTPRPPFFEGCSPSPLAPSYASVATADVSVAEDVGADFASAKRRSSKARVAGVVEVVAGVVVGAAVEVVAAVGLVAGVGALVAAVVAAVGVAAVEAVGLVAVGLDLATGVAIFDLDYDAILTAMYALSASAEGDCYRCVPPDPRIAAAALGASESGTLTGTAPAEALHTFTLDSGASRLFFHDSTTLTPLPALVPVRLADPSRGPVLARSSTILPCPAVPSGSLSGLHLPSFSANLRVTICTCTQTGCHLATFTRQPGSSLYTLATEPPQVSASGQVAASCSCRLLSHQTLLWHHRLGHPSLPRLRGMHSRLLDSGLPRSLPPLPPLQAPPCLPCVEGRQHASPHSSSFPPTIAPLQTLHMDVWGPARVSGQSRDRHFLLVVDDYTQYTTVFPLRSKGQVVDVLIPWIRTVRVGTVLWDFCRGEGILQSFTLPDSPQQNGITERRIGLVMEVTRTSMIHAAAPHFQWPFAVRYAVHQLNLWPRVSLPETSPTLRWTGEVGDASVFRVWGSRAFVRDTSTDKLSARAISCVFLGFVPDMPGWQFYHPTSRRVFPSQDVTFDESVPFYCLFPYRSGPPQPPPLFLAPGPPPVDPLPPQGPAPLGVSQVDPLLGTAPVQVAVSSGAAPGTTSGGAASGGAEPGGAESEGAGSGGTETRGEEPGGAEPAGVETGGVEPGGPESEGAESGGAEPRGATSSGGPAGASPRLSPQQLREWLVQQTRLRSGATGAGGIGDTGAGGAGVTAGAGDPTEPRCAGAGGAEVEGTGAGGAGVGGVGAGGAGGTVRPRPYFVPLLQQVLGVPSSSSLTPPLQCPPPDQSQPPLLSASPLPAPSPYTEQSGGLTERREPTSRPVLHLRPTRRVPCSRPPPVPGTPLWHSSDHVRAASPTVSRLLATAVTNPSFESAATSALVAELLDFAAACRLDYAIALVAESTSATPPSFEGDPDAQDIPIPRSYAEAITGPYSSQWQAAMDAEMASWKSTGTYVDEVPQSGAYIVDGMWIFRVKRPPGSPPGFKARYVAQGFSQGQGVDYFQTFSPTPGVAARRCSA